MWRELLAASLGTTVAFAAEPADEKPKRPIDGISDNSFLIEEAYNQDPGVVQHIFNAAYGVTKFHGPETHTWNPSFTQEWPVPNMTHQLSYTVPYNFVSSSGRHSDCVGDVLLNYRYQAYFDEKTLTGLAPRFSLVLPTGDEKKGFGNNTLGYQWLVPFSTTIGDRWFVHANTGLTFLPDAGSRPTHDLLNYNLGASAIYCASDRLNFLLEWVGAWNQSPNDRGGLRRDFAALISPGVRYAFNFANESQIVVGVGVPVGITPAAPDIGAFLYFSFEHRVWGKKP